MDPCGHRVFHQVGGGHTTPQIHQRSCSKFHKRKHICSIWGTSQNYKQQWYTFYKQRSEENARTLLSEASLVIALLSVREWAGKSNKQNPH